jgi:hypothetical protein
MEVLFNQTLSLLGRFIAVKEPNIRYLGLEAMAKFCAMPEAMPIIRRHLVGNHGHLHLTLSSRLFSIPSHNPTSLFVAGLWILCLHCAMLQSPKKLCLS